MVAYGSQIGSQPNWIGPGGTDNTHNANGIIGPNNASGFNPSLPKPTPSGTPSLVRGLVLAILVGLLAYFLTHKHVGMAKAGMIGVGASVILFLLDWVIPNV